jgi:outer membrane protein
MKKLLIVLMVSLLSVSSFAAKVAMVDIQRILIGVDEGKRVRGKLEKMFKERQKKLDKEKKSLQKLQEDFKKQNMVMSEKAKSKKEREIQEKIIALQQMSMQYQNEMQAEENKNKGPILKKITTIVETVAKKQGYEMVFGASTAPIYVKEAKDITKDVITAYNKKHK